MLVVVTIGALAGTTALVVSGAERARAAHAHRAQLARAAAESGIDAVLAELATQREAVLRGQTPEVGRGLTLRVLPDGSRLVFRVVDLNPDEPTRLASENARLDVNSVTREILSTIADLSPEAADAILSARGRAPIEDVADLASIAGLPLDDLILPGERASGGSLARLLTTTAFDPNTQVGAGPGGEAHAGLERISIHQDPDALRSALAERCEPDVVEFVLERLADARPPTMRELVERLGIANAPDDRLRALADVLTTQPEAIETGRVDLNRAPASVLASIPGLGAAEAEAIVAARDGLDEQTRLDLFWPVRQGLVGADAYPRATDWLAVRSMQWRVRVEGGIVPGEDDRFDDIIGGPGAMDSAAARIAGAVGEGGVPDGTLRPRVVLEAVIDLSGPRPRLATITDLTELALARTLRAISSEREPDVETRFETPPAPGPAPFASPAPAQATAPEPQAAGAARGARHGRWAAPQRNDERSGERPEGER
ncbi:MAG: hypothetical protein EA378_05275 [Phycisphaerales bacterium]|nr:MAG: hypothetical protein EA378_05275 [Phycisphaerales bacterium]